jgi:hypothetical protein
LLSQISNFRYAVGWPRLQTADREFLMAALSAFNFTHFYLSVTGTLIILLQPCVAALKFN